MQLKNLSKWIALFAAIVLVVLLILHNTLKPKTYQKTVFALNTVVTVTVYGENGERYADDAIKIVTDAEKVFSAHRQDSELAQLNTNHKTGVPYPVSDELFGVLEAAQALSEKTQGKFDITIKPVADAWSITENPHVPSAEALSSALEKVDYKSLVLNKEDKTVTLLLPGMQLDLGGIAKGYVADKIAAHLTNAGAQGAVLDLGGNIIVFGKQTDGFKIGIQTPFADSGSYTVIYKALSDTQTTIVTSGAYERNFEQDGILYHHILDPYTGYPHNGTIESVSVIGTSSMHADALSTYLFMLSPEDAMAFAKSEGFDVLIQTKDKKIYTTLDKSAYEIADKSYTLQ